METGIAQRRMQYDAASLKLKLRVVEERWKGCSGKSVTRSCARVKGDEVIAAEKFRTVQRVLVASAISSDCTG